MSPQTSSSLVLAALALVAVVSAYPNGPPVDTHPAICTDMMPIHGHDAMNTTAPFTLSTSSACFKQNGIITVTIDNSSMTYYEGFFVQAKLPGSSGTNYGTFEVSDADEDDVQTLDCFNKDDSAIGHKDKAHYWTHTFTWTAPSNLEQDIQFIATMVHEQEEFWVDVTSSMLTYDATCNINTSSGAEVVVGHVVSVLMLSVLSVLAFF